MISYQIADINDAEKLVSLCRQFAEDIDVIYQRYTIDAKSLLGVTAMVGNIVSLEIITKDDDIKRRFSETVNSLKEGRQIHVSCYQLQEIT